MEINHKLAVGLGIAALALPTAAVAKPHDLNANGQTKTAQYIVKGAYAGSGVVSVDKANGHARKAGWKGEDVAFDFSSAQIDVEDTNLDGVTTLDDVVFGVPVKVKARLPKGDPGLALTWPSGSWISPSGHGPNRAHQNAVQKARLQRAHAGRRLTKRSRSATRATKPHTAARAFPAGLALAPYPARSSGGRVARTIAPASRSTRRVARCRKKRHPHKRRAREN